MSLASSISLKKLIFVSLTEDDRSESLMAFSEDLTGKLWKEKGTQRCLSKILFDSGTASRLGPTYIAWKSSSAVSTYVL